MWAAVLFASFVIGICIREVRFYRARTGVEVAKFEETTTPKPKVVKKVEKQSDAEKLAQELTQKAPSPRAGGRERLAIRSPRPEDKSVIENINERVANMSEEQQAEILANLPDISEEDIAQMIEKFTIIYGEELGQMIREKLETGDDGGGK
ncbi:MAG: hypothetical protein ACYS6K_15440 [Planctomycetota bacterium]